MDAYVVKTARVSPSVLRSKASRSGENFRGPLGATGVSQCGEKVTALIARVGSKDNAFDIVKELKRGASTLAKQLVQLQLFGK